MKNKVHIEDFPQHKTFIAFIKKSGNKHECARFNYDFGPIKGKVKKEAKKYCKRISKTNLKTKAHATNH